MAKLPGSNSDPVPILVIAFNRPQTLQQQLARLDQLPQRNILISIDGKTSQDEYRQARTIEVVEAWAKNTTHSVDLRVQSRNLGLYEHFPHIAHEFFGKYQRGIILEDDIWFSKAFLDFTQYWLEDSNYQDYWSVSGHNPSRPNTREGGKAKAFLTDIHTIWGWATVAQNIASYLSYIRKPTSVISSDIEKFAVEQTRDPFLQRAIELTWKRKFLRSRRRDRGGSWDNSWVLAGWANRKLSLMPTVSLSHEYNPHNEGASHTNRSHFKELGTWDNLEIDFRFTPTHNKKRDRLLMRTWGISRKYAWIYSFRVSGQLRDLAN